VIVVGGEALVDLVISPDGQVAAKLGGGPYNVARSLGRLGRKVGFLSAISTDRFGEQLFDALRGDGVDPSFTVRTDRPTTLAAAQLDESGAASYEFYLADTSAPSLDQVPDVAVAVEAVHLGTLGIVLQPMADTIEKFLASLPADTLVMLDPNCRPSVPFDRSEFLQRLDRLVRRSHVVKVSTDDAAFIDAGRTPLEIAQQMVADGVRVVLLTAGGDGTTVVTAGGIRTIPTEPVTIADTIGAGDSFGAAFLCAWLESERGVDGFADLDALARAVVAAQQVAAITCSRVGADPPWRHELPADWGRV
jgi:fructokinase